MFSGILFLSCELQNPFEPELQENGVGNLPPETHIFLPDSIQAVGDSLISQIDTIVTGQDTLIDTTRIPLSVPGETDRFVPDTTESRKVLYWWGDDPDGEVTGYFYKWNFQGEWTFTRAETDTFYLPIRSAYDEFSFEVKAVDDSSAEDPTPSRLTFPVFNSPPTIEFVLNSNPGGDPADTTTTFPTRTFLWNALDPDGNETLVGIEYLLLDGTRSQADIDTNASWVELAADEDRVTLRDITAGPHTFFVRARDIAGAYSDTIQFPDPDNDSQPGTWMVNEPQGDVCLVNDYPLGGVGDRGEDDVELMYRRWLNEAVGEGNYTIWRIGSSLWHPENSLPYATEDVEASLNYFDKIIWYQYSGAPHYPDADLGINKYLASGGSMILTAVEVDTSAVFIRVDSMYVVNPQGRFFNDEQVVSTVDSAAYTMTNPNLIGKRLRSIIPRGTAQTHYRLNQQGNPSWEGTPTMGYLDRIGGETGGELLFLTVPLHQLNGRGNIPDVLEYYLNTEFEN